MPTAAGAEDRRVASTGVPSLVALAMPGGQLFVRELVAAWEAGDAVLPLDVRLPPPATTSLLDSLAPAVVVDEAGEHHRRPGALPVEEGDALVVATSGTTAAPRGAVLTHAAVRASAEATSRRLRVDPGADRWLACLPLAHVGGLGVVTRALTTGTPLTVHARFEAAAVEAAARDGATLVSLVPSLVRRVDVAPFRAVLVGGAALDAPRPENVVSTYGMTETAGGVVYDGVPLEGVEVRVDDTGQVHLRGPMLLRVYRDGNDPRDADGWVATGDAGRWDSDGRLVVEGRLDDVIVTGGQKVWPAAVEAVLATHPAVGEVAVAGRGDPEWGQRVVALVVPADPVEPPDLDVLRALVKEHLPAWAAPRELVLVAALPRTPLGKLRRGSLTFTR